MKTTANLKQEILDIIDKTYVFCFDPEFWKSHSQAIQELTEENKIEQLSIFLGNNNNNCYYYVERGNPLQINWVWQKQQDKTVKINDPCGQAIQSLEPTVTKICSNCKHSNEVRSNFCNKCGQKLG